MCKNYYKVQQGRSFSFNHILCSYILPIIFSALMSAYFPHSNTQLHGCNQMQSIVMVGTNMFQ